MTIRTPFVMLAAALLASQGFARAPVPKQRLIDPDTIVAYEKLGAVYGTIHTATNGRMEFIPATEGIEPGGLPAFRIVRTSKVPYPEVNVPFGLSVFPIPGNLKPFAGAKKLTSVISGSMPDLDILPTLPDLRHLRIEQASSYGDVLLDEIGRLTLLESLDIYATIKFTAEGKKNLGKLKKLEVLLFQMVNLKFDELDVLADPKRIRSLELMAGTDGDLVHLKGFENLESLALNAVYHNQFSLFGDGAIEALRPLKKLRRLDLKHAKVTDAGMRSLGEFTELRELNLADTKVTDRGIRDLAKLSNLERLDLSRTFSTGSELAAFRNLERLDHADAPLGEAGGKVLDTLRKLTHLNLARTPLTATAFRSIAGLPSLVTLDLTKTPVADAVLKEMKSLPTLRRLVLDSTLVTDEGVETLRACRAITHLNLSATTLTDASVKPLGELQGLIELDLSRTDVTDKQLDALSGMKSLALLKLTGTKVTEEAKAALRVAHPKRRFW